MMWFIRSVGIVGALLCLAMIVLMQGWPKVFERTAIGFAKQQVTAEVQERYPGLGSGKLADGVSRMWDALGKRQKRTEETAEGPLPGLVAEVISAYCGCTDPVKKQARADAVRAGLMAQAAKLGLAQDQLTDFVKGKYDTILSALKADLTIFLGTNLFAFAAVFAVSFVGRDYRGYVVIPGLLLLIAAAIASWVYLTQQDWFYTIVYQNYYGWGYAVIIGVIFGLLLDIIVNRARVCLKIASNLPFPIVPVC